MKNKTQNKIWFILLLIFALALTASCGEGEENSGNSTGNTNPPVSDTTAPVAGSYVAFGSLASNLVAGDTNNYEDVFVHDMQTSATTRVSVDSAGVQGNNNSSNPAISADGRYVAFESFASNLVAGDTNGSRDVFVHDRQTGTTTRVSVDSSGNQGNSDSSDSVISGDGRYVAFRSSASNLVAGDTNSSDDIFVYDIQTGATTRVSVDSSGNQGNGDSDDPAISGDGRYVAFESFADNLVTGDTNNGGDIFVHDRGTGATTIASVDSSGNPNDWAAARPSISGDGRYVAFQSNATNLVTGDTNAMTDIFVRDRQAILTTRVSISTNSTESNNGCWDPSISGDGSKVVFWSSATNLALNDTNNSPDVFMREGGATKWVSNLSNGDNYSYNSSISRDGGYVAFWSAATNLVAGDTNGIPDIFVRDTTGTVTLVSVDSAGVQANGASSNPAMN